MPRKGSRMPSWMATPDAFMAWLDRLPADKKIGQTRVACRCPLSTFFRYKAKQARAAVSSMSAQIGNASNTKIYYCGALPIWAKRFIYAVDGGSESLFTAPVLAGRARKILAAIAETIKAEGGAL